MKSTIKSIRFSQEQMIYIKEQMALNNQTFSNFIFESISKPKKKIAVARANQDLIIELAKWGNNLNQVAKHLNTKKSGIDRVGLEMLSRIENHLEQIRAKYAC